MSGSRRSRRSPSPESRRSYRESSRRSSYRYDSDDYDREERRPVREERRSTRASRDSRDDRRSSRDSRDDRRHIEDASTRLPLSTSYIIKLPSQITDGLLERSGCKGTGKNYVLEIRLEKKK